MLRFVAAIYIRTSNSKGGLDFIVGQTKATHLVFLFYINPGDLMIDSKITLKNLFLICNLLVQ